MAQKAHRLLQQSKNEAADGPIVVVHFQVSIIAIMTFRRAASSNVCGSWRMYFHRP